MCLRPSDLGCYDKRLIIVMKAAALSAVLGLPCGWAIWEFQPSGYSRILHPFDPAYQVSPRCTSDCRRLLLCCTGCCAGCPMWLLSAPVLLLLAPWSRSCWKLPQASQKLCCSQPARPAGTCPPLTVAVELCSSFSCLLEVVYSACLPRLLC